MRQSDEKKYENLIRDLKNLQRIKASSYFEADLKRRINAEKQKVDEKSLWKSAFVPSRIIPSLGLATAAIVVFLVINVNSEELDNPFLIEPRLREDIIAVEDFDSFEGKKKDLKKEQTITRREISGEEKIESDDHSEPFEDRRKSGREEVSETDALIEQPMVEMDEGIVELETSPPESTLAGLTLEIESAETSSEMATGLAITKNELNFRQVQLSEIEQQKVDELRMRVQSLQNVKKSEDSEQK